MRSQRCRRTSRAIGSASASSFLLLFGTAAIVVASPAHVPSPGIEQEIDWHTSPLDLNLRGLNGERFRFRCPPGKVDAGQVIGRGPYTDGSSICPAAVHAGVIQASRGGPVTIEVRPGQAHYGASLNHYIQSARYEAFWSGSFVIVADGNDTAAESPQTDP